MLDEKILNTALSLAMEFGEHWLQPIQPRLATIYPNLSQKELDEYHAVSNAAMKFSHNLVGSLAERDGKDLNRQEWESTLLKTYPWIQKDNLDHLYSQGMYFAWKDGFLS